MRKLTAYVFMSLDGVIEAPDSYIRPEAYPDFSTLIDQTLGEQDAVILGRKTYEEWSAFWPTSDIQPFADFINTVPKFVFSKTLANPAWHRSVTLSGPLETEIATLKSTEGGTIGVHGSISLVQSLLAAGLLDEIRITVCPVIAGDGRRLLANHGANHAAPIQLDLVSAQSMPTGLQYLVYHPR